MTAKGKVDEDSHTTFSALNVHHFKISPKSILDIDPMKDGVESLSLSQYVANDKKGKKPANPVVVEGFGKRNMYPKREDYNNIPDSNRIVPGMPNCIKSKGVHEEQVYSKDTLIVTDNDLKFNETQNQGPQYTDAQQIVMNGRPITWSTSSTATGRSNLNSIEQSAPGQEKYDPASGYESTKDRVNKLMETVNMAVSNVRAPTENQAFARSDTETRNLAFSAVPFQPWVASKIMPAAKFDPKKPYIPMQIDFKNDSSTRNKSIIEDHSVLNNPIVNIQYKNFNRTAQGFGNM